MEIAMSFGAILDTLLFKPLQLLFEVIYMIADRVIDNPGLSIIVLSLVMNFLVLPLYKRADAMQEEERDIEMKLRDGVAHIKKTFSGDEKMMILQTYYRQNNYKPTYVLRGAVSLFLQIPFFIAAYRFLSGLSLLNGVSFGPIADLGKPDGMLEIAGVTINILPVIMTAVNLVSCVIFTKGGTLKSKIQLYAMALFFLVFLYTSPAGLVFYWTLNNVFSLIKTIFYKLKHPGRVLSVIVSLGGIALFVYGLFFYPALTLRKTTFFIFCAVALQFPLLYSLLSKKIKSLFKSKSVQPNKKIFFAGGIFLSLFTGVLIPSTVINASPQEFVDINYFYNPLWYVVCSFCFAAGIFVIWLGVFYWLAKPSGEVIFERAVWILSGVAIADYMFFGKDLGILSADLKFDNGLHFDLKKQLINAAILLAIAVLFYIIIQFLRKHTFNILVIASLALAGMSVVNAVNINASVSTLKNHADAEEMPSFTLSRNGKNVVVLMLDRAVGEYIPYLFHEKPELEEKFSGFTYYSNVISFGGNTNFGAPALFGGYEYTPEKLNKRDNIPLVDKHDEALKVMPLLFDKNGYDVTVCDAPYAGYQWIPDLSIYDDYPDIQTYLTEGKFTDNAIREQTVKSRQRNFFCYGILKSAPLCFQEVLYNKGSYNGETSAESGQCYGQIRTETTVATGRNQGFMDSYNVMTNLPHMTDITEGSENTFLMMANNLTHNPMLLSEPEYEPRDNVDNTIYDSENTERFTLNGRTLKMETDLQVIHYQSNMAAMIQLGNWFDYLRENDVYDNTRIIVVSDHGYDNNHLDELILEDGKDISSYYPLLMVKDFDSEGFTTSEEFMTNADVPSIATKGVISTPSNPFSGVDLSDTHEKTARNQYILCSDYWEVEVNNGNKFLPGKWYSVHDDMRDTANWKIVAENAELPTK